MLEKNSSKMPCTRPSDILGVEGQSVKDNDYTMMVLLQILYLFSGSMKPLSLKRFRG